MLATQKIKDVTRELSKVILALATYSVPNVYILPLYHKVSPMATTHNCQDFIYSAPCKNPDFRANR